MKTYEEMENKIFECKEKDPNRLAKAAALWQLKNRDESVTPIEEVAIWFYDCGYKVELAYFGLGWKISK